MHLVHKLVWVDWVLEQLAFVDHFLEQERGNRWVFNPYKWVRLAPPLTCSIEHAK